jgi:thiol-disulfide isomerase/thioredoxin
LKVYKFYKNDCPPCYALGRIFYQIEIPDNVEIVEMNVAEDNNKNFAKSKGINTVPALMKESGEFITGKMTKTSVLEFLGGA